MGRPKGLPKTGGRKAGTPNRARKTLVEICESEGVEPFAEMLRLSKRTRDEGVRLACYKECAKYLYPQVRSVEFSGSDSGPSEATVDPDEVEELLADLKEILRSKAERDSSLGS